MAEPVSAAAIAAAVVAAAAKSIGERIGKELADGIFGKDSSLEDIQIQLREMSLKLDSILTYSRATFILVENIPNIVAEKLDEQTLYKAHNELDSSYKGYLLLGEWHGTIGYETIVNLMGSWNVVVEKEDSTEKIINMPRYAEHMLIVTHGQLFDIVKSGITSKRDDLDAFIKSLIEDEINHRVNESEKHLNSGYVASGDLLDSAPWLAWSMNGTRTKTIEVAIPMPCSHCNGSSYHKDYKEVADTVWNNALTNTNSRLIKLGEELDEKFRILRSATAAREVLDVYDRRLTDGVGISDIASIPHIKILESQQNIHYPQALAMQI